MRFTFASADSTTINSATGAIGEICFRSNSPYDPNQSGVGAQPRCFDQWMAMYREGVVLGSKVVARFFLGAEATSSPCRVFIVGKDVTTAASETEAVEGRHSTSRILTRNNEPVTLVSKFSYKRFCKDPNDEDDLMFTNAGNCTQQYFYHIGGFALNAQTETMYFTGYIDYICLLKNPIDPAQS